ncbi:MAG: signal transduction protein [Sphingomonadales bacterium]|nr:signal transduction protein [Sphingomonadales bacterium]
MHGWAFFLLAALASPALSADEAAAGAGMSLADFQAASRTRMMQADADHDGRLSATELSAAAAMRSGGGGGGRMFKMLDGNGDGFLDTSELDAMSARRFGRMDADGDGKVTAAEREASRGQRHGRGMGWRGVPQQPNPDRPNTERLNTDRQGD